MSSFAVVGDVQARRILVNQNSRRLVRPSISFYFEEVSNKKPEVSTEEMQENRAIQDLRFIELSRLFEELRSVFTECSVPNWDGYDALPVGKTTFKNAWTFLLSIPAGLLPSSVGADAFGDITFEWFVAKRNILTISINSRNQLHFAGLVNGLPVDGAESFEGELSREILSQIRRISSNE